jgi:hypothetical protein
VTLDVAGTEAVRLIDRDRPPGGAADCAYCPQLVAALPRTSFFALTVKGAVSIGNPRCQSEIRLA